VHPDQHGVDLAALADLLKQALGQDSVPAFTLIEKSDGNTVARPDVAAQEFVPRMGLPGVGRVTRAKRVCSTGRAAEPPPPVMAALQISTPGFLWL